MYQLPDLHDLAPQWALKLKHSTPLDPIQAHLNHLSQDQTIYPPQDPVFRALQLTPPEAVRVVLIGQDPYHGPNQANGLAFSVNPGQTLPPSLRNIFKELQSDLGGDLRQDGDLSDWASQGVLLLNQVLTVAQGQANSHQAIGWQAWTQDLVRVVNDFDQSVIFLLWGKKAQTLLPLIDQTKHQVIQSAHPSPLSAYRGFFGSRPFSQINQQLKASGEEPLAWG